ncbi:MAG: type II secretion system secretin GspD [Gammaproteobacteria bacterium]|nr:type II secretion system secretin GspD [Gammaproteobacteria bacterium]
MLLSEPAKAGFGLKKLTLACVCIWLTACSSLQTNQVQEPVSLVKIGSKEAAQILDDSPDKKTEGRTLLEHRGTGSFVNTSVELQRVKPASAEQGEMVKVSFENAPVGAVLEAILGDFLKVPYSLEGEVQGQISLISTDPVPEAALFDMLESALEVQGIAMVKGDNGIYRIGQSEHLRREIPVALREAVSTRGYSVRIIPLHYLSVLEAEKILTPLGLQQNILRVDPLRNILMLGASAPQMQNALRTLKMMDVDVLSGMSFGIYEVANLDAGMLVERIEKMIGNPELAGLASSTRLIALEEINSVMVVAPNTSQLNTVSTWVKRLDAVGLGDDDEQTGAQLYVYTVENGEAKAIADLLGQIFSGTGGTSSSSSTSGRVAPGLETSEASTSDSSKKSSSSSGVSSTTTQGGARIVADEANNSLLVMASAKEWRSIRAALSKIDKLPSQVLIEVSIWEVTLKDELSYGVEWFFNSKGGVDGLNNKGGLLSMNDAGTVSRSVPGFSYLFSGSDWRAVINALSTRSKVKSLSSPSVLVQDNKEANIQVGNQQPIQTSQTVNTSNTGVLTQNVELKDTGVQLKVKPRVNNGGLVIMDIMQEVTDVGATDAATGQRSFLKRSIESTVAIQSGDTIILGGLIQDNQDEGDSGVPFLHKLPIVGGLFGTKTDGSNRTELLITISPRAVNQYQDFAKIGDEFRNKMQGVTEAFRQEFSANRVKKEEGSTVWNPSAR